MFCSSVLFIFFSPSFANLTLFYLSTKSGKEQSLQKDGGQANVKLIVFDIQGKQVAELVNQKQSAGTYEVDFDGSAFSSGVYFYSLIADEKVIDTKKMILIK